MFRWKNTTVSTDSGRDNYGIPETTRCGAVTWFAERAEVSSTDIKKVPTPKLMLFVSFDAGTSHMHSVTTHTIEEHRLPFKI